MSLKSNYNPSSTFMVRIWNHASFGLNKDIGNREKYPANIAEKAGNAILWTVGIIPRSIKFVAKSFQDPRITTIALTALALLIVSFLFYPAITFLKTKVVYVAAMSLIKQVPFWAVKFSAYVATCASIIGAGLRAGGRFNNAPLMKEFYGLSEEYPNNPSRLFAHEIAERQTVKL